MDKSEAHKILAEQLARFGSYAELLPLVESGRVENFEICSESGAKYQVEIQFFWDDKRGQVIRVVGSIDDGGTRAFVPLTDSLLISPPESGDKKPQPNKLAEPTAVTAAVASHVASRRRLRLGRYAALS
jgi:hypothetical protein